MRNSFVCRRYPLVGEFRYMADFFDPECVVQARLSNPPSDEMDRWFVPFKVSDVVDRRAAEKQIEQFFRTLD